MKTFSSVCLGAILGICIYTILDLKTANLPCFVPIEHDKVPNFIVTTSSTTARRAEKNSHSETGEAVSTAAVVVEKKNAPKQQPPKPKEGTAKPNLPLKSTAQEKNEKTTTNTDASKNVIAVTSIAAKEDSATTKNNDNAEKFSWMDPRIMKRCPEGFRRPFDREWQEKKQNENKKVPNVYQISGKFGYQNKFEESVKNHTDRAIQTEVFDADKVVGYYELPKFIVDDPQWQVHLKFLTDPRDITKNGAGYWFWKATLIYHHLHDIDDGDFLIYVDNDVQEHMIILKPLLEKMVEQGKNLAMLEMPGRKEKEWTKRDVYEAYCHASPEQDERWQFDAMITILRKDAATMQFAKQYAHGVKDWHALSDEPSWLPNFDFFTAHRRDQSIVNAILKCRYQEPGRERYNEKCNWRFFYMYNLPVWDEEKLIQVVNATENAFLEQERLYKLAATKASAASSVAEKT